MEYLVKWKGFSSFENTWESREQLSQPLLRYFGSPRPQADTNQDCVDRLRVSVLEALKHKGPMQTVYLEFRHDVFKYLFNGEGRPAKEKNWHLYEADDFCRCKVINNWSCIFERHGDGVRIRFPVKMRKFLTLSPKTYENLG
ncbi:uncharacterized protein LOC141890466 [Acropora palmata]|uniref:uncharacterized protein LOC141890466 n=1 Tax=Acropora palmata TaxID=6131 RepID=UPI003DA08CCB